MFPLSKVTNGNPKPSGEVVQPSAQWWLSAKYLIVSPHGQSCSLQHSPATHSYARQRGRSRVGSLPGYAFHRPGPGHVKRPAEARVKCSCRDHFHATGSDARSEEHTSELSHEWISYAVFCLKKKK